MILKQVNFDFISGVFVDLGKIKWLRDKKLVASNFTMRESLLRIYNRPLIMI